MFGVHKIIQLHGCVPFYIYHMTWTSTNLPSWMKKSKNRKKPMPIQTMNSSGMNKKTIVNKCSYFSSESVFY